MNIEQTINLDLLAGICKEDNRDSSLLTTIITI